MCHFISSSILTASWFFHSKVEDDRSEKGVTHICTLEAEAGEFSQVHIQPVYTFKNKTKMAIPVL